ncbi:hypothetical protein Emag_004416 [Eimeria magna]
MEAQTKIDELKHQRRQERSRGRPGVTAAGRSALAGGRLSAALVSYKEGGGDGSFGVQRAAAPAAAAKAGEAAGGAIRRPRPSIMQKLFLAVRRLVERDATGLPPWLEARIQQHRSKANIQSNTMLPQENTSTQQQQLQQQQQQQQQQQEQEQQLQQQQQEQQQQQQEQQQQQQQQQEQYQQGEQQQQRQLQQQRLQQQQQQQHAVSASRSSSEDAASRQQQTERERRRSGAIRLTRRPLGAPMGAASVQEISELSAYSSPRDIEIPTQPMFG